MLKYHQSVLLQEVVEALVPAPGKKFIDATAGDGGHSIALAKAGALVLAIDQDAEATERLKKRLDYVEVRIAKRITPIKGRFSDLNALARQKGFGQVEGILFDLGLSSYQLRESGRGFSFKGDEFLDMRMDTTRPQTAADLLQILNENELAEIFIRFGEEHYGKEIAQMIVKIRKTRSITSTRQLAELVTNFYQHLRKKTRIHPATRVFQALRIAVNDELTELANALTSCFTLLAPQGRLAIISFHSLEDRLVKQFLKNHRQLQTLTKKAVMPTREEINNNPSARSAKLRVASYAKNN